MVKTEGSRIPSGEHPASALHTNVAENALAFWRARDELERLDQSTEQTDDQASAITDEMHAAARLIAARAAVELDDIARKVEVARAILGDYTADELEAMQDSIMASIVADVRRLSARQTPRPPRLDDDARFWPHPAERVNRLVGTIKEMAAALEAARALAAQQREADAEHTAVERAIYNAYRYVDHTGKEIADLEAEIAKRCRREVREAASG